MTEKTIGPDALAKLAGVSTDTLRYYERRGLLPAPPRTAAGYRQYPPSSVARVQLIRRALGVGFSVRDLARVLDERDRGGAPCRKVHELLTSKLSDLEREMAALAVLRHDLQAILRDWTARLSETPEGRQARLLDALPARPETPPRRRALPRRIRP
jgi:DNA-binding transcriptional MerR regulator